MEKLFMNLFYMSISASYLILAVLAVRFLLRNAPKSMRSFLWLLVGIRLVLPFSVESVFSLIPDTKVVDEYIYEAEQPAGSEAAIVNLRQPVNQPLQDTYVPYTAAVRRKPQTALMICTRIWLVGMVLMLGYMLISYMRLRNRVKMSVPTEVVTAENHSVKIYQSDTVESPFLFGILRPRIYIPRSISSDEIPYVVRHELTHKKRKDYLIKPIGFLLLSVYWFNPCVWAAYIMLCKDIELICDERVVRELGTEHKKAYSQVLLNSAVKRRMIAACPVAFGEVSVKERVKNVLNYKKPAFWVLAAAVLACIIVPVCFMTQKKTAAPEQEELLENVESPEKFDSEVEINIDDLLTAGEYELFYPDSSQYLFTPSLNLGKDGEFSFGYDLASSYFNHGEYDLVLDRVKAVTYDKKYHYQFTCIGDGLLRFDADESSELYRTETNQSDTLMAPIENGSIFVKNSALSAIRNANGMIQTIREDAYEGRIWTDEELKTKLSELEEIKQQLAREEIKLLQQWEKLDTKPLTQEKLYERILTQEQQDVLNKKQEMMAQQLKDAIKQIEDVQAECSSMVKEAEKIPAAAKTLEQWAQAFCNRDARTITKLSSEDVQNHLIERELLAQDFDGTKDTASFGWSSPWPWGDTYDGERAACNYHIVSATERSAEILYYAWVSDPHVTVWRELLTYKIEDGACIITSETLQYMDGICIAEEFYSAYPNGIAETMMDYYSFNGAGEILNKNAMENRNSYWYQKMFEPDTAAVFLLNILDNPNKVGVHVEKSGEDTNTCTVLFDFYEDGSTASVQMIQPYGSDGIWIPYTVDSGASNTL
ncbi:MAG: hypothetical protein K2N73_11605 [Lachnospiraceae bacterium]|nr:hypothetical protein [Lachnospiraceae bacterium]